MNKKSIISIFASTIWISISEFTRNELIFKQIWIENYQGMNLTFPDAPINGSIWGIWALVFSIVIYIISSKFDVIETCILSWVLGFVMMWLVIGNLGVLPFEILKYAIPLSIIETYIAVLLIKKINR